MASENSSNAPLVNREPMQTVMMVHPVTDVHEHHIAIIDIYRTFKAKLKWFFFFAVLLFLPIVLFVYWNGQVVTYRQLISIPTIVNQSTYQLENWLPAKQLTNAFNAHYLQMWKVQQKPYVNNSFDLTAVLDTDGSLDNPPAIGLLWLTVKAPIKAQQNITQLFAEVEHHLQTIVDTRMHVWKQGLGKQIAYQENLLVSLNTLLSDNAGEAKNNIETINAIEDAQIRKQILDTKQALQNNQSLLSSIVPSVQIKGPLLISTAKTMLSVIIESTIISILLAVIIMVIISYIIINTSTYNTK